MGSALLAALLAAALVANGILTLLLTGCVLALFLRCRSLEVDAYIARGRAEDSDARTREVIKSWRAVRQMRREAAYIDAMMDKVGAPQRGPWRGQPLGHD